MSCLKLTFPRKEEACFKGNQRLLQEETLQEQKEGLFMIDSKKEEQLGYSSIDTTHSPKVDVLVTLPDEYGEDGVVILARDPYWAFTYWEISNAKEALLKTELGERFQGAEIQLRVYEFASHTARQVVNTITVPVRVRVGSWYLLLGTPGSSFQAEIGYLLTDGTFVSAARSNKIELPHDDISSDIDGDWMIVEEDFKTLFKTMKKELTGSGSLESYIMREDWMKELKSRLKGEAASGLVGSPGLYR